MHHVASKFVPCLLTDEQKEQRVAMSQELLDQANSNENFLKNTVMGDEMWVYGYNVETSGCQKHLPDRKKHTKFA
jgi:hypothetical protein